MSAARTASRGAVVLAVAALLACSRGAPATTTSEPAPEAERSPSLDAGARGRVRVAGEPTVSGAPLQNVDRILAAEEPRLAASYQRALARDPAMAGSARYAVRVDADGKVLAVDALTTSPGLSSDVVEGTKAALRAIPFDPPGEPGTTLEATLSYAAK